MAKTLSNLLKWGEISGVLITAVAILFRSRNLPYTSNLFLIGLSILAAIYFAYPMVTNPKIKDEGEPGIADILTTMVRKLMFIGISVLCVAYLFTILHLEGANEIMITGLFALIICLMLSAILVLGKRRRMALLRAPFVRSIVVLVLYFLTPLLR